MKIRNRLTLILTLTVALSLLGLSLFVFYFTTSYQNSIFFNRLLDRVEITEKLYLEEDRLPPDIFQDIRERFLHTLEEETEIVLPVRGTHEKLADSLKLHFPPSFVDQLFKEEVARYEHHGRLGAARLYHDPKGDFMILVEANDVFGKRLLANLKKVLLLGCVLSSLIVYFVSQWEARHALLPVAEKIEQAREIGAQNLHLRLQVHNEHDELGQLAITFNQMLDRLETAFEMKQTFISNASHEIFNPLAAIIGEAEVTLQKNRSEGEYKEALTRIYQESNRLNELVTALLSLSKTGFEGAHFPREQIRLDELLMELVTELGHRSPPVPVEVDLSQAPEDPELFEISGNYQLLRLAFLNLLDNAGKFSNFEPVGLAIGYQADHVHIEITDRGIGIPAGDLTRIYEPFFRSDNARHVKGFGIGLALTQRLIQLHQGELSFFSEETKGTRVTVRFGVSHF